MQGRERGEHRDVHLSNWLRLNANPSLQCCIRIWQPGYCHGITEADVESSRCIIDDLIFGETDTLNLNHAVETRYFRPISLLLAFGGGTARAEYAQGTPTQSHISSRILVYEE